jgi:hypothetical protein
MLKTVGLRVYSHLGMLEVPMTCCLAFGANLLLPLRYPLHKTILEILSAQNKQRLFLNSPSAPLQNVQPLPAHITTRGVSKAEHLPR